MSAAAAPAAPRRGPWSSVRGRVRRPRWRPRTLRGRLVLVLLTLLLAACLVTATATAVLLRAFLLDRLDGQLVQAGGRFSASLEHGHGDRSGGGDAGDDGSSGAADGDADGGAHGAAVPGQAVGTLGVRLVHGRPTEAAVVDERGGARSPHLGAAGVAALAHLPVGGAARTVDLGALGDYRVVATAGRDDDVQVTGLPLHLVSDVVGRLVLLEAVLSVVALCAAGAASAAWVRRSLRPLEQVADTALHVARLPLTDPGAPLPDGIAPPHPTSEADRVSVAFDRMLDHLRAALAARDRTEAQLRRFVADASHELRTPLATVRAHTDHARRTDTDLPAATSTALARIDSAATRMTALVEDLLLLARLDSGRPLAREPVELTQLVLEVVADARAAARDHRWALDLPEEPVDVTGDGPRLHQVLANLAANAHQHTPAGTAVTTTVRRHGDGAVEVSVTDDGPGIPADRQDDLFDRFTHGATARASSGGGGGAGLGLAIARGIAVAHGGVLDVTSRPGRTSFRLRLPAPPPL